MDAYCDQDYVRLHAALTRYLALPAKLRTELERLEYGEQI